MVGVVTHIRLTHDFLCCLRCRVGRERIIGILIAERCHGTTTLSHVATTTDYRHPFYDISPDTGELRGKSCPHRVCDERDLASVDTVGIGDLSDERVEKCDILLGAP